MKPSIPSYLNSWALEIASRANRVRDLIGDAHWLSDGTHKEFLIREFLARHLPNDLTIDRGFVKQFPAEVVSPEIDVLISSARLHVPFFNEGGLQIVPPSSVLATLEVKSTYGKSVLKAALENVALARQALGNARASSVWSGIVFVQGEQGLEGQDLIRDVRSFVSWPTEQLPSAIFVMNRCIALMKRDVHQTELVGFTTGAASCALGFAQLFGHLRAELSGAVLPGELDDLLEALAGYQAHKITIKQD